MNLIGFRWLKWCAGLALLAVATTAAYFSVAHERASGRAAVAATNAMPLPAGTQRAWSAYVDRRLAATLRRSEAGIVVRADIDGFLGYTTDIPYGSSFEVTCTHSFGGIVRFNTGGDTLTASIFGSTVESPAERPPPLGVSPRSEAALGLQKELCDRIVAGVQAALAR